MKAGAVSGVLSKRELAERMRDRPELSSIRLRPATLALMLAAAVAASAWPAWRASRTDPLAALRYE